MNLRRTTVFLTSIVFACLVQSSKGQTDDSLVDDAFVNKRGIAIELSQLRLRGEVVLERERNRSRIPRLRFVHFYASRKPTEGRPKYYAYWGYHPPYFAKDVKRFDFCLRPDVLTNPAVIERTNAESPASYAFSFKSDARRRFKFTTANEFVQLTPESYDDDILRLQSRIAETVGPVFHNGSFDNTKLEGGKVVGSRAENGLTIRSYEAGGKNVYSVAFKSNPPLFFVELTKEGTIEYLYCFPRNKKPTFEFLLYDFNQDGTFELIEILYQNETTKFELLEIDGGKIGVASEEIIRQINNVDGRTGAMQFSDQFSEKYKLRDNRQDKK